MFIAIEGGDGVGKTTLARGLAKALRDMGYKVFLTEEPGGTKAGWDIKENIMKNNLDPVTEFLLFEAEVRKLLEFWETAKIADKKRADEQRKEWKNKALKAAKNEVAKMTDEMGLTELPTPDETIELNP